jgi:nucleotide-binding universal stress UspA family protein
MTKLLAAVDNSTAALPVVGTACAVADVFGAKVEALHVVDGGDDVARAAADAALIPYWRIGGEPGSELLAAADDPDVIALTVGSRDLDHLDALVGGVTRRLITEAPRPVVVVPPGQDAPSRIERILVALDRDLVTTAALHPVLVAIAETAVDIVVVHVCSIDELPPFADQVQHETSAWADEFLARYSTLARERIRLELRYGDAPGEVSAVAARVAADLVVLAWAQSLDGDHAAVVRTVLAQDRIPVLLVPISFAARGPLLTA